MKIKRLELLNALALVKPGLATKENVEQSTTFAFFPHGIATYNDEISIYHPIKLGIEGAILGRELYALLNKLKVEEIELELEGSQLLVVYTKPKGGITKSGIKLEAQIHLPLSEMGSLNDLDWKRLPKEAVRAMEFCMFSCSRERNKQILQCVHMVDDIAEATDNFRIMRYYLPKGEFFPFPMLVHANVLRKLVEYHPVEVGFTDGWVHFANEDDTIFSCRVMSASDFPDVDRFINASENGDEVQLPEGIGAAIDTAGIFSSNKECGRDLSERIRVTLQDGEITVRGEGAGGWLEDTEKIDFKGSLEFEVNPAFLKAMLSKTTKVQITKNLLRFSGEEFVHVISTLQPRKK